MSNAESSRLDDLVSRYLDGALADSDATELLGLLEDPACTARFLAMTRLNSQIAGLLAAPVPDATMVELVRADIQKHVDATRPTREFPRRQMPAWSALARAAVLLIVVGLAVMWVAVREKDSDIVSISTVHGEARLSGTSGTHALKSGEAWRRGETLNVASSGSSASVNFRDGSRIRFTNDSIAVNLSDAEGYRLRLDHGELQAAIPKQPGGRSFILSTPVVDAIVSDAELTIISDSHHTRVYVTSGQALLRRPSDGAELSLRAGFRANVGVMNRLKAESFDSGATDH